MGRFGSFDHPLEERGVDLLFVFHVGGGCFSLLGLQVLASLCEGEVDGGSVVLHVVCGCFFFGDLRVLARAMVMADFFFRMGTWTTVLF